jgi:hypothetical protein
MSWIGDREESKISITRFFFSSDTAAISVPAGRIMTM